MTKLDEMRLVPKCRLCDGDAVYIGAWIDGETQLKYGLCGECHRLLCHLGLFEFQEGKLPPLEYKNVWMLDEPS